MFPLQDCFRVLVKWIRLSVDLQRAVIRVKRRSTRGTRRFQSFSSPFAAMKIPTQLQKVFNHIDTNSDGKISSLELREVLVCLGSKKSKAMEEADGIVREMDGNGDGCIDLDEFMEIVCRESEEGYINDNQDIMDAFLIFDKDRNGFISAKELQRILVKLGYRDCNLHECLLMIKGVDKDGDGLVDFEEFTEMMNQSGG